jgi:hypothetical protein
MSGRPAPGANHYPDLEFSCCDDDNEFLFISRGGAGAYRHLREGLPGAISNRSCIGPD